MLRTILKPLSFVPALIMMYIIFSFSAQDGDMSGQLSYQASVKIIETADYVFNANLSYDQIDEWANKSIYHPQTSTYDRIFRSCHRSILSIICIWTARHPSDVSGGLICVGFACGDEFHQIVYRRTKSFGKRCLYRQCRRVFWDHRRPHHRLDRTEDGL